MPGQTGQQSHPISERGELAPGQKLPAERDLADERGIAYQTVRRAMRELRERGLVVSRAGKGTFVVSRQQP
jgi:GntR family transcriptional regulator